MKRALTAILLLLAATYGALAQSAPANLPYHTVYGRLGSGPGDTGPGQAIPFATLAAQLGANAIPTVTIESQHGGCNVPDNTKALLDAVNSVSVLFPVRVLFPNNCAYNFRQANAINFTKNGVYLEGAGKWSTQLQYTPTTDGPFLQWSNGLNVMTGGGIGKLSLYSSNTTNTKVMVQWYDVQDFDVTDIFCSGGLVGGATLLTGGAGSQCIYSHGRDTAKISRSWLQAQIPLHLGMNPHYYLSLDHYHFSDLILVGELGTGTRPVILVDPGVVFTSTTFDGQQEWLGGTHGIDATDTAAAHLVSSVTAAGSGYTAGSSVALTGGTCSSPIHITPLTVNGSGGILTASIDPINTGVCSVTPSNPVSAASGGAAFNLTLVAGFRLSFANVRSEQGVDTVSYTFNIKPVAQLQGLVINNSAMDSKRCGAYLKNTFFATIEQSFYGLFGCGAAVHATSADGNDMLNYVDNFWVAGTTHNVTGLTAVRYDTSPTGTSATVPPTALYSSTTSSTNFNTIGVNGSFIQCGTNGCSSLTVPAAVGSVLANKWGSVAGTIVTSAASPIVENSTTGAVSCPTCGVTGSPLSQFASTTSAQLAGVLSDETGTGLAVFNNGPALTNPTVTTQAVDDNSTKAASTAYVVGQAAAATPLGPGTAAVGTSTRYARADHVHPTDTAMGVMAVTINAVDFNVAGDVAFALPLPSGFTRILPWRVDISGASAAISGGTFGVFSQSGGAGIAILAAGTSPGISTASDATVGNAVSLNLGQTAAFVAASLSPAGTIYFRKGTTVAGTANVTIRYFAER